MATVSGRPTPETIPELLINRRRLEPLMRLESVVPPETIRFVVDAVVAVSIVVDAYGKTEKAAVEEEKNTPWVQMEVVVASVVVEKLLSVVTVNSGGVGEVWQVGHVTAFVPNV